MRSCSAYEGTRRGDQPSSDLSVGGDQRGFQAGPKARATSSLRNTGYTRGLYSVLVKETRVPLERLDAKLLLLLKSSVTPDTSSARRSGVMKASKPVDRGLRAQMNLPTRGYWELHYPGSSHFAVYLSLWLCVQLAEQKASAGPELERLYTWMAGRDVELYGTQGAYNVIASSR